MSRVPRQPAAGERAALAEIDGVQGEGLAGTRRAATATPRSTAAGQDEAFVVVGVLADQVHAPGREGHGVRVVAA